MLFSSITFLYYFLPIVLILYYVLPRNCKNMVLLISSLIFYAWGEPKYVILMIISIMLGYVAGMWMQHGHRKMVMSVSIVLCLSFLFYFKYANFFIGNINALTGQDIPLLKLVMPIGISFYTFQIVSYIMDVYYERIPVQKNVFHLATYITMFPQLIAGPIVRYSDINEQLEKRNITLENVSHGVHRFILGLSKKVLLANQLGELCSIFKDSQEKSVAFYWLYAVALILHYYFDFSGYSDMAIGMGKFFGFDFMENFNYPYMSKSITEFWRRWHISLGTWFRDYVYIPLGGNRKGEAAHIRNIFVVWLLTGFWHGAEWNFILWGLFFGVFLLIEKKWILHRMQSHRILSHVYVLFLVMVSFVVFDIPDMQELGRYLRDMFFMGDIPLISQECIYYFRSYFWILCIGIVGATDFPVKLYEKLKKYIQNKQYQEKQGKEQDTDEIPLAKSRNLSESLLIFGETAVQIVLLLLVTAYLVDGSFNPFLYFRF